MSRIFDEFKEPAIQTKIVLHFGGFFYQIKECQRLEIKEFYTSRLLKNEEIGGIFVFSGSEL
jgi:hypothetical protein